MRIILASQSPRRRELMDLAKFEYEVLVSEFEEKVDENLSLDEQSKELAYGKAKKIYENTQGNRCIIGADTLIVLGDEQLGKPRNREEAFEMISKIQGKMHVVYTGFAILIEENGVYKEYREVQKTKVFIKDMSNNEIERYIDTEYPYDKAGGYAIQNSFAVFIEKIDGNYTTVMGLPIHKIYDILKDNGIV